MSIDIRLGISALATEARDADAIAQRVANEIAAPFLSGSNHDIVLQPFVSSANAGANLGGAVSAGQLHAALEAVTGYQRRRDKVTSIGLLIADTYKPAPGHFGVMFDENFEPGSSNWPATTPREGCAIFLEPIASERSESDFDDEVLFTAIHEVAHVFNLQHVDPPSYVAQSAGLPAPISNPRFTEYDQYFLSKCSESTFIWPGGSRFTDLGDLAPAPKDVSNANAPDHLRLEIGMDRQSFWPFEPVELDVEIALRPRSRRRTASIPATVDPGYGRFVIWIEEPDGERRRYRSPRHYCERGARLTVSRAKPMRRDISIFGESGRFTFRKVGWHHVWATFAVTSRLTLTSNVLELNVLPPAPSDSLYAHSRAVFTDPDLGKLMYHRRLNAARRRKLMRLADFSAEYHRQPSAALVHYALGRALAGSAREAAREGADHERLTRAAIEHLRVAAEHRRLGDHRRWHAEAELQSLGAPERVRRTRTK